MDTMMMAPVKGRYLHAALCLAVLVAVPVQALGEARKPPDQVRTAPRKPGKEAAKSTTLENVQSKAERLTDVEWAAERERMRKDISTKLTIRTDPDGLKFVSLPDDPKAGVRLRKGTRDLTIEEAFKGEGIDGSGSVLVSEAVKRTGSQPEKLIRFRNLTNPETLDELNRGVPASETKLGRFGKTVAGDLGRKVKEVHVEDDVSEFGSRTGNKNMVFDLE
jgi:hypothetical protein